MIVNTAGTFAISNLGYVDKGSLWSYALGEAAPRQVYFSDSKWLSIIQGTNNYFSLIHQNEDSSMRLTAHSHQNIAGIVSSIELHAENIESPTKLKISTVEGDTSAWSFLPKAYIVRAFTEPFLLLFDGSPTTVEVQPLLWHQKSYDTMYQGILGVTEIPGSSLLVFSIQRNSEPVVYDPAARKIVTKFKLGGHSGSPQLFFRRKVPELWASDYDTLVRLDSRNWNMLNALKLQEAKDEMERLFIGEYCFNSDESLCAVARPFSGDVVGIDPKSFSVAFRAETGGQPEDVGLLRDNRVIARDWKTGRLLQGTLQPI